MNIRDHIAKILYDCSELSSVELADRIIEFIVPPLVWDTKCARVSPDGSGEIHCQAEGQLQFKYTIATSADDGTYVSFSYGGFCEYVETVEDAQAKANAHHCKQILSPSNGEDT